MRFPDRATVDRVKAMYPPGSRVVLDWMDDCMAPEVGTQGTIICVDDAANAIPIWDTTGGRLSIVFGYDECHMISTEEEARTALNQCGWSCKTAIVMILLHLDAVSAGKALEQADGRIAAAIGGVPEA